MVLTEGRKQCSASVVFESMGKFWRSRWSVRLKRTGEPRDAQVELVRLPDGSAETGEIVAEQKLAWNAKVPEVLGMDYETFTRSALLAQGAFTELLRAQVDDRAAILERLQTKPSMFGFAAVNSKRISAGYVRQQPPAHV